MHDLLDQMRANPAAGWRIADVERVCRQLKVKYDPPRGGGSHYKVFVEGRREILTIPFKRPIKPVYIRKLVVFLSAGA